MAETRPPRPRSPRVRAKRARAREEILSAIETGETRIVWLPEPIPVHVLYWTAWVDRQGAVHFRRDVYDRDGPLERALGEGPLLYQ